MLAHNLLRVAAAAVAWHHAVVSFAAGKAAYGEQMKEILVWSCPFCGSIVTLP